MFTRLQKTQIEPNTDVSKIIDTYRKTAKLELGESFGRQSGIPAVAKRVLRKRQRDFLVHPHEDTFAEEPNYKPKIGLTGPADHTLRLRGMPAPLKANDISARHSEGHSTGGFILKNGGRQEHRYYEALHYKVNQGLGYSGGSIGNREAITDGHTRFIDHGQRGEVDLQLSHTHPQARRNAANFLRQRKPHRVYIDWENHPEKEKGRTKSESHDLNGALASLEGERPYFHDKDVRSTIRQNINTYISAHEEFDVDTFLCGMVKEARTMIRDRIDQYITANECNVDGLIEELIKSVKANDMKPKRTSSQPNSVPSKLPRARIVK